jgi:hypothetical protein
MTPDTHKNYQMKKLFLFIAVLLVIVSCSKENNDQKELQTKTSSAELKLSTADSIAKMNAGAYLKSTITAIELDSIAKIRSIKTHGSARSARYGSEYTDWSGLIHFQIFSETSDPGNYCEKTASVGSDWVLVGGGARTTGGNGDGSFLTASYPNTELTTWNAKSQAHIFADIHTLYVYAIGMKIDGVSPDYLRANMQVFSQPSSVMNHPNISATVTSDYLMIGGGANDQCSGYGNMLTASYPSGSNTWTAAGKDHRRADPSIIIAYAIGIKNISYPNVGYLQVGYTLDYANGYGYVQKTTNPPTGWATTCCGAFLDYGSGAGRMIESNSPTSTTSYVLCESKDQTYTDNCSNYVYAMRLQKAQ